MTSDYLYTWHVKTQLPERFGQRCRRLGKGGSSVIVQFEDGQKVVCNRMAIRRVK